MNARRHLLSLLVPGAALLLLLGLYTFCRHASDARNSNDATPLDALVRDLRARTPLYYSLAAKPPLSRVLPKAWLDRAHMAWTRTNSQRTYAVWKFRNMGTNAWPALPALVKTLNARDFSVSVMAANALAAIHADDSPAWPQLEPLLLGKPQPAQAFRYLLTGRDPFTQKSYELAYRRFALAGLAATGAAGSLARQEITNFLQFEVDPDLRAQAVIAHAAIQRDKSHIIPFLKPILQNQNEWAQVRAAAAEALARSAPNDPATRSLLWEATRDVRALVRLEAARSLWKLQEPSDEILAVLIPLLNHNLVSIRVGALKTLAEMGDPARPSIPAIERLTSDEHEAVRRASAAAIESIATSRHPTQYGVR